ncbi:MAG: cytochrome P450 [Novosphingobium sp.]|nr:cytochrome P450 [Novosphingobium sp.]
MELITTFDHYATPLGADGTPYAYFEKVRDEALAAGREIGWSEAHGGFWVTTGWQASREIHQNNVDFSNRATTFPQYATPSGKPFMLSGQDEPEHTHYRRMVQAPFTKVRAMRMLDQMREIADMLVDRVIDKDAFDVCEATDPMPGYAFCAIVGLSMDDASKFRRFVHAMVQGATDPEGASPAMREMEAYWRDMVELRRREPNDGLLSEIINSEYDGERLNDEELLDFFTVLLLGGFDNTLRFLANAFHRLACDTALRRQLAQNPELIPSAVEEFLRLDGPACIFREVVNPITLAGVDLKPGQIIGMIHQITNRDPRQFPDPDRFIADRKPNHHFALGIGIHHCLGAYLAKAEAIAMIERFLARIPEFQLNPNQKPHWVAGQVGGFHSVPIERVPIAASA